MVARLLPFVRRSRRRFPCHAADATLRIRFEGLELWQQPYAASGRANGEQIDRVQFPSDQKQKGKTPKSSRDSNVEKVFREQEPAGSLQESLIITEQRR